jgi:transposase
MSSVNKKSVREEFDVLKARFEQLCAQGKMEPEGRALVEAMLMLFELLIAVFMERHTTKNSNNSSKPGSQTPKDDTAVIHPGAKGKGKGEKPGRCGNTRTVQTVDIAHVHVCETCGQDLTNTACVAHERRTKIDIVFEKVVLHIDAQIKECPRCQTRTKGRFPADMSGPLQYGAGVKAYILNMIIAQMVSFKRVQQSIKTLIGQVIAEATMLKYIMQLHLCLEPWQSAAAQQLLTMPAMHVDETSLRVDKKNHWIHVCSGGDITLKFVHPKRGCEAIQDIGIIPRYGGVVIHDCWQSYLSYEHSMSLT